MSADRKLTRSLLKFEPFKIECWNPDRCPCRYCLNRVHNLHMSNVQNFVITSSFIGYAGLHVIYFWISLNNLGFKFILVYKIRFLKKCNMNTRPKITILEILVYKINPDIKVENLYTFQVYRKAVFTRIWLWK